MLPPASKKVATGGPLGSNGKGAVAGSSDTPPRPPCADAFTRRRRAARVAGPATGAAAAPAAPAPPRPRPRPGAPLLARIQTPEKSILPSAVRGGGAS